MAKINVFLGDMVHDTLKMGTWMIPINIGFVAEYAKLFFNDEVNFRLFKFPVEIIREIKSMKPDVVGLSFYEWNRNLSELVGKVAKEANPDCVVVYGGPSITNLSLKRKIIEDYFNKYRQADFYVYNQGEKGFTNIIERYIETNGVKVFMYEKPIEGVISLNRNGPLKIEIGPPAPLFDTLDEIPSPYLSGLLDSFFGKKMIPLMESHRGCPYRCGYCAWGISTTKVQKFDTERVKEELHYISERAGTDFSTIQLADGNFGIFERDIEIAEYVRKIYEKKGFPRNFVAAWAKESDERILNIAGKLRNLCNISLSFQSMNPETLRVAKRKNLTIERAGQLLQNYQKKGIRTVSELILGLPEETLDTHIRANETLIKMGVKQIINYNLHILNGTFLASDEIKKKYYKKTRFRIQDCGFGEYEGKRIIEEQEIVTETTTISMEEMIYFRVLHWLIQLCYSMGYYVEILKMLELKNISPIAYIGRLIRDSHKGGDRVSAIFRDFRKVATEELHDSREGLIDYWVKDENFSRLVCGDHGKLNYQYTFRILLECKSEFEDHLKREALLAIQEKKIDNMRINKAIDDLFLFMGNRSITLTDDNFHRQRKFEFQFDILRWKKDGYKKDLTSYWVKGKKSLIFSLPTDQFKTLKFLLKKYNSANLNLTIRKMSEYINPNELFYKVD